jgi:hypothetical protein
VMTTPSAGPTRCRASRPRAIRPTPAEPLASRAPQARSARSPRRLSRRLPP